MSDPIVILLVLTAVMDFVLGSVVLWNRRNDASFWFSAFTTFLGIWTVTIIGYRLSGDAASALAWMRSAYVAAMFIAVPFWYVALNFPARRQLPVVVNAANALLIVLFAVTIWGSDLLVQSVTVLDGGRKIVHQNPLGWALYASYFLFYFLSAHVTLFWKYRKAVGLAKKHLRFLFSSVFIGGEVFGVFFNLILPSPIFNEWRFIWIGPVLTAIVIVPVISYAITAHQLLNIKLVASETLVVAGIVLAFIDVFFSRSPMEFALRFGIFLAVCVVGVLLVKSVLTEVRRREDIQRLAEDLRLANTKLRELSETKSNFISIASHQLRAPIGGVRGYLSMLREGDFGKLGRKVDDVIDLNMDTLNHTLHVIETFLNVTRIEAGKMDLNKEPVDLCSMTRDIYKELALSASRKKIRLLLSCPQKSATVRADKEKLRNVIFNLVENALKYTEHGTIKTTIDIGPKRVEMRVTDTGIGLAPEEVPQLFAKFVRAGGGLKISHGSGLGLYIVKTLIEAHGGEAFVESPGAGKGSTFGFRMPASKAR